MSYVEPLPRYTVKLILFKKEKHVHYAIIC